MADDCYVLPSGCSARALLDGEQGAVGRVAVDTLERAALIGVGLAISGESRIVRPAILASLVIEGVVLLKAASSR
jgi:hypothetical protein